MTAEEFIVSEYGEGWLRSHWAPEDVIDALAAYAGRQEARTVIVKSDKGLYGAFDDAKNIRSQMVESREQQHSPRMEEFLDRIDKLCFEFKCELYPTFTKRGIMVIEISGDNDIARVMYIDGDGRGK